MNDATGVFGRISLWCLNHDEPKKMQIVQNLEKVKTPFYSCEDYAKCSNRMNLDDYTNFVFSFIDRISKEPPGADLTNYEAEYKGTRHKYKYRVLEYSKDTIRIGILNKTVLGK